MKTIQLKDILAISGKGGLYKFIAQARNGIVVESIEDKKRHVAPATARVSSLEDIAIFTQEEEVALADIFYKIHDKNGGKETISHKASADELKSFFEELVPEYDEDRVYVSDIKKVFQWYNQLHQHGLLELVEKEEEDQEKDGAPGKDAPGKKAPGKDTQSKAAVDKDFQGKNVPVKGSPGKKSGAKASPGKNPPAKSK